MWFEKKLPVDLVPFGGVADTKCLAKWPPKGAPIMNVIAFDEVANKTIDIAVGKVYVRVVSFPSLALLKLVAWENNQNRTSDIEDFVTILKNYHAVEDNERLWAGRDNDLLYKDDFEFEGSWYRIFGRDVGKVIRKSTTAEFLLALLEREKGEPLDLVFEIGKSFFNDFSKANFAFNCFTQGVFDILIEG